MTVIEQPVAKKNEDAQVLDTFAERVLDALYELGLMPLNLSDKPASYEKYPQELITMLEAKGDVEMAFTEWQSKLLRKQSVSQAREQGFAKLNALHAWMLQTDTQTLLRDKTKLRHLRKSMFGRTYAYLFTRLSFLAEYRRYCDEHDLLGATWRPYGGDGKEKQYLRAVSDEEFIYEHFVDATRSTYRRLADLWGAAEAARLREQAISFLMLNYRYFSRAFASKDEPVTQISQLVEE